VIGLCLRFDGFAKIQQKSGARRKRKCGGISRPALLKIMWQAILSGIIGFAAGMFYGAVIMPTWDTPAKKK